MILIVLLFFGLYETWSQPGLIFEKNV